MIILPEVIFSDDAGFQQAPEPKNQLVPASGISYFSVLK
jgi:hypothetical protein